MGGFRGAVTAGETIEIQHHHKKAKFRVVWLRGVPNSQEKQIEDDLYDY